MKKEIIPSIIAKSQDELDERISKVRDDFSMLQLDVMDGEFVKNKSLDFDFELPKELKYEAHLMVRNIISWIEKHGTEVDRIIFHFEAAGKDVDKIIKLIRDKKKNVGIAINPLTEISEIKPYLELVDMVLVMTVNPEGYGGKFLPLTLKKVESLRKLKPGLNIEVDGGINDETIALASVAGANMFISGSYLQESKNIKRSLTLLESLLGNVGDNNRKEVNNGS